MIQLTLFVSCSIESYTTKKYDANEKILSYLNSNELDVVPDSSGLVFIMTEEGRGDTPKDGDKVAFHYTGYFLDGEMFDTSYDKPYPLIVELGNGMLISGLEEALKLMNKGAKATIVIPFYLAYDDMDNAPVPPYSDLIFELELVDFTSITK